MLACQYGSNALNKSNNLYNAANRNYLTSYEKGVSAELCAKNYLKAKGYEIVGKRVRNKYGEIDIIAKKENNVIAIEVKQRQTLDKSRECISKTQQHRIARAFSLFISERNEMFENYRIDVVCFDILGRFEHIEDAFFIKET